MLNKVRRIPPERPKWESPELGAGFFFGIILWILTFIVFLFMMYVYLFSYNLNYLLNIFTHKKYIIPFWVSLICVLVLPFSIIVILLGIFVRIIKEAQA